MVPSITDTSLQPMRFTPHDIQKQLEMLNTAKATGPDNILAIVLKTCDPELATLLAKLFQYSYNTSIYPTMWRIAQACPVQLVSYHPNRLLSDISKVMERVINSAIKQHLLGNNLLSDAQFGFCQGRSALDFITALVQTWTKELNYRRE
eukprot:g24234.t1